MTSTIFTSCLLLVAAQPRIAQPHIAQPHIAQRGTVQALEVRVGIVAFQDFETAIDQYEQLFRQLADNVEHPLRFKLAIGTYGDVLHWLAACAR